MQLEALASILKNACDGLALFPRQIVETPAAEIAAVFLFVQWAFEALQDVDQMPVADRLQSFGGFDRAYAATAEQQNRRRFVRRMLLYLVHEGWVELHAGEFLPGDVYRFGRMADETVFDRGSNVDQYRGWVVLQ